MTTNPAPIATRLRTTCTAVNVASVIPQTMEVLSVLRGHDVIRGEYRVGPGRGTRTIRAWP